MPLTPTNVFFLRCLAASDEIALPISKAKHLLAIALEIEKLIYEREKEEVDGEMEDAGIRLTPENIAIHKRLTALEVETGGHYPLITRLRKKIAEKDQRIAALEAENAEFAESNLRLVVKIEKLEAALGEVDRGQLP